MQRLEDDVTDLIIKDMRRILLVLVCLLGLCGCRTVREAESVKVSSHDTVYVSKSDVLRDSVYVDRWRDVYVSGDTVHEVRCETVYRWRLWTVTDTLWKAVHSDSVAVSERTVEVERERSGYDRFVSWGFWILLVVVLAGVVLVVYKKLRSK